MMTLPLVEMDNVPAEGELKTYNALIEAGTWKNGRDRVMNPDGGTVPANVNVTLSVVAVFSDVGLTDAVTELTADTFPGRTVSGATSSATTISTDSILLIMSTSMYPELLLARGLAADRES
jgi:hypothetical protein